MKLHSVIEGNLNAIARTPKMAREELLRYVVRPELIPLLYSDSREGLSGSQAGANLIQLCQTIDIEQDPYIIKLRSNIGMQGSAQLEKALRSQKTYCQEQLKSLYTKYLDIHAELGSWAADYYINAITQKFCTKGTDGLFLVNALDQEEKTYLKKLLRQIEVPARADFSLDVGPHVSRKVQRLIDYLTGVGTAEFTGLVFVKTRATCAVLAHLLSAHVRTKDTLRVSTFVGMSTNANKKFDLGELVDIKDQKNTLDHLRRGQKNLVISTSALEEGIDVSACNLVICYEKPPNLKSFIQRRGRARKLQSKYVIFFPEEGSETTLAGWQQLEEEMRKAYMDEMRQLQVLRTAEELDTGERVFKNESTGYVKASVFIFALLNFCFRVVTSPLFEVDSLSQTLKFSLSLSRWTCLRSAGCYMP